MLCLLSIPLLTSVSERLMPGYLRNCVVLEGEEVRRVPWSSYNRNKAAPSTCPTRVGRDTPCRIVHVLSYNITLSRDLEKLLLPVCYKLLVVR
jgi:hypothetical protein